MVSHQVQGIKAPLSGPSAYRNLMMQLKCIMLFFGWDTRFNSNTEFARSKKTYSTCILPFKNKSLRPAGIWMHCSCNTSVESFYRLNINAQKILQVIPIPVDSGRADLTAGWYSVTAHDFLDRLTKDSCSGTQQLRNQEDVDLPSSHGGAKARICHSCLVSRPWRSEWKFVEATVSVQFQCRAEGVVAASALLLWRCVRGLCFAAPPAVFAVEIWVWNQRSTQAPWSLLTFCLRWGSLAVTSLELSLKGWDLAAFSKPRGNQISFNELLGTMICLERTLVHWGSLRQDQGDYAAPKFGGCN